MMEPSKSEGRRASRGMPASLRRFVVAGAAGLAFCAAGTAAIRGQAAATVLADAPPVEIGTVATLICGVLGIGAGECTPRPEAGGEAGFSTFLYPGGSVALPIGAVAFETFVIRIRTPSGGPPAPLESLEISVPALHFVPPALTGSAADADALLWGVLLGRFFGPGSGIAVQIDIDRATRALTLAGVARTAPGDRASLTLRLGNVDVAQLVAVAALAPDPGRAVSAAVLVLYFAALTEATASVTDYVALDALHLPSVPSVGSAGIDRFYAEVLELVRAYPLEGQTVMARGVWRHLAPEAVAAARDAVGRVAAFLADWRLRDHSVEVGFVGGGTTQLTPMTLLSAGLTGAPLPDVSGVAALFADPARLFAIETSRPALADAIGSLIRTLALYVEDYGLTLR